MSGERETPQKLLGNSLTQQRREKMTEEKLKRRIRYEQKKSRKGRRRRWK